MEYKFIKRPLLKLKKNIYNTKTIRREQEKEKEKKLMWGRSQFFTEEKSDFFPSVFVGIVVSEKPKCQKFQLSNLLFLGQHNINSNSLGTTITFLSIIRCCHTLNSNWNDFLVNVIHQLIIFILRWYKCHPWLTKQLGGSFLIMECFHHRAWVGLFGNVTVKQVVGSTFKLKEVDAKQDLFHHKKLNLIIFNLAVLIEFLLFPFFISFFLAERPVIFLTLPEIKTPLGR
jgi:hypothetical protein